MSCSNCGGPFERTQGDLGISYTLAHVAGVTLCSRCNTLYMRIRARRREREQREDMATLARETRQSAYRGAR